MANTILTPKQVTRGMLLMLENNLVAAKYVERRYEDRFAQSGAKIGDTINIRKPNRFTVSTGAALSTQDISEGAITGNSLQNVTLTVGANATLGTGGAATAFPPYSVSIGNQAHVDTTFTSAELTLSLQDFSDRILRPKMAALANKVDFDILTLAKVVANSVGTPGTTPGTALTFLQAGQKLDEMATPRDGQRTVLINPAANAATIDNLKGLFQSSDRISDQYENGNMGQGLGFRFSMDQNVNTLTTGTHTFAGALTAQPANGVAQLAINGQGNTLTIKQGEVFTIAGIFAVNPQSRQSTGALQQFTVMADATSSAGGAATINVYPPLVYTGAYQNISAQPAGTESLTWLGAASTSYPQNLAFHKEAITLATVDLEDVSQYGAWGAREVYKGVSLRTVRQYRVGTDDVPCRVDVLYGAAMVYAELACRIWG